MRHVLIAIFGTALDEPGHPALGEFRRDVEAAAALEGDRVSRFSLSGGVVDIVLAHGDAQAGVIRELASRGLPWSHWNDEAGQ